MWHYIKFTVSFLWYDGHVKRHVTVRGIIAEEEFNVQGGCGDHEGRLRRCSRAAEGEDKLSATVFGSICYGYIKCAGHSLTSLAISNTSLLQIKTIIKIPFGAAIADFMAGLFSNEQLFPPVADSRWLSTWSAPGLRRPTHPPLLRNLRTAPNRRTFRTEKHQLRLLDGTHLRNRNWNCKFPAKHKSNGSHRLCTSPELPKIQIIFFFNVPAVLRSELIFLSVPACILGNFSKICTWAIIAPWIR